MGRYFARRVLQVVPVLIGITLVTFFLLRLTGDPAAIMLPPGTPRAALEAFRTEYGLDQPLYVQYVRFVGRALQGDFGLSIRYREPVVKLYLERLPATLELAVTSTVAAIVISIPIGVLSAAKQGRWFDNAMRLVVLLGQAVPGFYLGILLILIVAVQWRLLPTGGRGTWQQLILPAMTLAILQVAVLVRFTRGAVLDAMRQDYVRTGRSKGLTEPRLFQRHILRNALLPVITIIGLQVAAVFNGAVVTETVFAWPGIGRLVVDSISTRDFPVVQVTVMFVAVAFVLLNLLVDLAYGWLDPRIKYG